MQKKVKEADGASPKVLSFDNENKNFVFCFALFSLFRTFAP